MLRRPVSLYLQRERETERERERQRETDRQRQTERETERERERQTQRQRQTERQRETERQRDSHFVCESYTSSKLKTQITQAFQMSENLNEQNRPRPKFKPDQN